MFVIKIHNTDQHFLCDSDKNLLQAIGLTTKKGIPIGCRRGGCGICKVKVLEGVYHTLIMSKSHIDNADLKENIVLACRVKPSSNLIVEIMSLVTK